MGTKQSTIGIGHLDSTFATVSHSGLAVIILMDMRRQERHGLRRSGCQADDLVSALKANPPHSP
jgi:hypothetical protein